MASSRVMPTTTSANSDLPRQPSSPLLYPLSPVVPLVVPVGGSGDDPQTAARALGPVPSMNMEDIFCGIYVPGGGGDVVSPAPVMGETSQYCGGAAKMEDEEDGVRRAADEVWRPISVSNAKIGNGVNGVGGASSALYPVTAEMTLEDFLTQSGIRVGVEMSTDEDVGIAQGMILPPSQQLPVEGSMLGMVVDSVLPDPYPQSLPQQPQQGVAVEAAFLGFSNGLEGGAAGRGKRRALLEPEDKIQQQRQRRMIKNRESAARSRERKQAYTVDLEKTVAQLEEENMKLRAEQEEVRKKRLKQLLETLVPVTEKRRPSSSGGLRRSLSMQ